MFAWVLARLFRLPFPLLQHVFLGSAEHQWAQLRPSVCSVRPLPNIRLGIGPWSRGRCFKTAIPLSLRTRSVKLFFENPGSPITSLLFLVHLLTWLCRSSTEFSMLIFFLSLNHSSVRMLCSKAERWGGYLSYGNSFCRSLTRSLQHPARLHFNSQETSACDVNSPISGTRNWTPTLFSFSV